MKIDGFCRFHVLRCALPSSLRSSSGTHHFSGFAPLLWSVKEDGQKERYWRNFIDRKGHYSYICGNFPHLPDREF